MKQVFIWFAGFSALAFVSVAVRIFCLKKWRSYGSFLALLLAWAAISLVSLTVPVQSSFYFTFFLVAVPLSWLLYILAIRRLYRGIFVNHRGIETTGRTALYTAGVAAALFVIASVAYAPPGRMKTATFTAVFLTDRGILCALVVLLILLVGIMIRFPIKVARNLAVHSIVFSSILLFQVSFQVIDQWSSFHYEDLCNTLTAILDTGAAIAWAFLLTNAGDVELVRFRNLRPELEAPLMAQLEAMNGVLLRAARK